MFYIKFLSLNKGIFDVPFPGISLFWKNTGKVPFEKKKLINVHHKSISNKYYPGWMFLTRHSSKIKHYRWHAPSYSSQLCWHRYSTCWIRKYCVMLTYYYYLEIFYNLYIFYVHDFFIFHKLKNAWAPLYQHRPKEGYPFAHPSLDPALCKAWYILL